MGGMSMGVTEYDRELRVALAMNGGVSLAVWIGGVGGEFYRASRGEGLYGGLAQLTRTNLVIDILTGASAGGLNGAFIASAMARQHDGDIFDSLRNVWLTAGSLTHLLRDPSEKDPPSLLQGDAFFLKQVEAVIGEWLAKGRAQTAIPPEVANLDLVLTATTLKPITNTATDAEGNRLVDPRHRARFHFTGDRLWNSDGRVLARQLARAARTSASFPGGFEPSFVQVGPSKNGEPDMAGIASFDESMWAVDGGVLVNKPIGPAFELIERHQFAKDGTRVLVYVNPDPGTPIATPEADKAAMPAMGSVLLSSIVTIPRQESIASDLAEMNDYNRRFGLRRKLREALLLGIPVDGGGDELIPLADAATMLYPLWLRRNGIQMSDDIVRRHLQHIGRTFDDPVDPSNPGGPSWSAIADDVRNGRGPSRTDPGDRAWLEGRFPSAEDLADPARTPWRYGLGAVRYLWSTVTDLTRRALDAMPVDTASADVRRQLVDMRTSLFEARRSIDAIAARQQTHWATALAAVPTERSVRATWARTVWPKWDDAERELRLIADAIVTIVCDGEPTLIAAADAGHAWREGAANPEFYRSPNGVLRRLTKAIVVGSPAQVLRHLLALYVVHDATEDVGAAESRLTFVQLSASYRSPLAPTRPAEEKVRGLDVGHFGGFIKTSWRANDWMWGCLDGSAQVAELFLEPERIKQLYPSRQAFVDAFADVLLGVSSGPSGPTEQQQRELATLWTREAIDAGIGDQELAFLDDRIADIPERIPRTAAVAGKVMQQLVAARELPAVGRAVTMSETERALVPATAKQFLAELADAGSPIPLARTAGVLAACKVGSESAKSELSSDALVQVVANAAAVAAGTLAGKGSGIKAVRPLFATVRTVLSAVNLMVQSTLNQTRAALVTSMTLLAVGGGLVASKLLGANVPTGPLMFGISLLAGFTLLIALVVSVRRALLSIGTILGMVAVSSIDRSTAMQLCCDPDHPGWKPWLHSGGAVGLLLIAVVMAWRSKKVSHVLAGLVASSVWSTAWWLVRDYAGDSFVDVVAGLHAWRAVWIVAAIPVGVAVASVGSRLWPSRR